MIWLLVAALSGFYVGCAVTVWALSHKIDHYERQKALQHIRKENEAIGILPLDTFRRVS